MSTSKRVVAAVFVVIVTAIAAMIFGGGSASAYNPGEHPTIGLSKSSGLTGDSVVVSGQGFSLNSSATLVFESTPVSLGTVATSATGTFSTTITVPDVPVGPHHVLATDGVTGKTASAAFDVTGSGTAGAGGTGSGGGSGGGLASTGVAVVGIASLGLVLLIGGGLMLLAGRRRKITA